MKNQTDIKGLETNLDHYKDEILESCLEGLADTLAVVKGNLSYVIKLIAMTANFTKINQKIALNVQWTG